MCVKVTLLLTVHVNRSNALQEKYSSTKWFVWHWEDSIWL